MNAPKNVAPVAPSAMGLLFTYRCPNCGKKNDLVSPIQPGMVACNACAQPFPILPVDGRTIHFIHIMLNNGKAAVDQDFI